MSVNFYDKEGLENLRLQTSYGENGTFLRNSIEVKMRYIPTGPTQELTPSTLEVTKHETGHTYYAITNTLSYYLWLRENQLLGTRHDGHQRADPSGKKAVQFGKNIYK